MFNALAVAYLAVGIGVGHAVWQRFMTACQQYVDEDAPAAALGAVIGIVLVVVLWLPLVILRALAWPRS